MTFQVANGSIPETVERWLVENLELEVFQPSRRRWRELGRWRLVAGVRGSDRRLAMQGWVVPWTRKDRGPTLQEAIEAVVSASRG